MDRLKRNEKQSEYSYATRLFQNYRRFGVRHLQMLAMALTVISLYIVRGSMTVAVLAMCGGARKNDPSVVVYNWDQKTQGLILSSFFWGYVPMQIPAGILSKNFGGKPILLVALILNGLLCCLIPIMAAVGGWSLVCLARVGMGLAQSCLYPATFTLHGQWLPPNELTSYSGMVCGGVELGTIISLPIAGFLAESALGWKMIFYTMGVLLLFTAVIWHLFAASSPAEHKMISKPERLYIETALHSNPNHCSMATPWKQILTSVPVWAMFPAQVGAVVGFILYLVDMPTYLEKGLNISLKNSAYLSALPHIGMWIGSIVSTILAEKLINKNIIATGPCRKLFNSIAMFGTTAALFLLMFVGPEDKVMAVVTLVTGLTLYGFGSAGLRVNYLDLTPNFAGVLISLTNVVAQNASILMPIITSYILNNDSSNIGQWRIVFLVTAVITAGTNVLYLLFSSSEKQKWNDPDFLDRAKADPEEAKPMKDEEERFEKVKEAFVN